MFKNKKSLINLLCWFLPLQVGIIFLSKNLQVTEQGMISGVALVVISFFLKTYLDNKENLEFYTQLINEQIENYNKMINRLRAKRYESFNENIDKSIQKFQRGLLEYLEKQEAKGRRHRKTGELLSEPKVDRAAHEEWIKDVGVELRGGDLDESPYCYKHIEEVLEAHSNTIDVLHTLHPLGVCMASSKEYDPYKD